MPGCVRRSMSPCTNVWHLSSYPSHLKAPIHEATLLLKTVASNKIELQPKRQQQLLATRNNTTLHHTHGNIVAGNCCQQQSCLGLILKVIVPNPCMPPQCCIVLPFLCPCRIARMVRQPRGNALLVGVGGTGKQSLTRLASHMCGYQCFQIELTRGYNYDSFHEDLKKLYLMTGVQGQNTVFLFTDTQVHMHVHTYVCTYLFAQKAYMYVRVKEGRKGRKVYIHVHVLM